MRLCVGSVAVLVGSGGETTGARGVRWDLESMIPDPGRVEVAVVALRRVSSGSGGFR